MSADAPNPVVTIAARGPLLVIDYPPPDLIGQLAVDRPEPDGEGGTVFEPVRQALFGLQRTAAGGLRAVVWAGLLLAVVGLLKRSRVPFTFEGGTPDASSGTVNTNTGAPQADSGTTVGGATVGGNCITLPTPVAPITDPALGAFAAAVLRGLVRYAAGTSDPLWLIVQVCLGRPAAKVVVLVRKQKDAADLTRLLRRHGISPGRTGCGTAAERNERVVVTLLGQMGMVELAKADVVLVTDPLFATWDDPLTAPEYPDPTPPARPGRPEPRTCVPARATSPAPRPVQLPERLIDAGEATVIGFLPIQYRPSPFERARLWQLFGTHQLVIPGPGCVERGAVVARIKAHTGSTTRNAVDYVKNAVRMNPVRNRRLAALARALQAGDESKLRRLAPSSKIADCANQPLHVLLLAENIKQAEALKQHLPAWPLVSGLGDDATVAKDDTTTCTRGVIATALGVEALAGEEYDVIVRAAPGDGAPPLPEGWLATDDLPAPPLLIVDAEDDGHPLAALWSRRRKRHYRAAGWAFLDEDPDVSAWLRFREVLHKRRARQ